MGICRHTGNVMVLIAVWVFYSLSYITWMLSGMLKYICKCIQLLKADIRKKLIVKGSFV